MSKYSRLPQSIRGKQREADGTYVDADFLYNYIHTTITSTTIEKRKQLKATLDNFCTFWWRGVDAFETFGAFIVNKDDLKFYNGPGFSNSYVNPQFESAAGQLTGVKFKTQQISFTIGVYWISIEHYRQLIYWLHPYEINTLAFGFDHKHYYQVKLANMSDSTRSIIGYERVRENPDETPAKYSTEPRYYTEIKLTFEVQGAPCAYNWEDFRFLNQKYDSSRLLFYIGENDQDAEVNSDIEAPVQTSFALSLGLRAENFINHNNQYDLSNTTWHLITNLDVSLFDFMQSNSTVEYNNLNFKVGDTSVCEGIKFYKTAENVIQISYYHNSAWDVICEIDSAGNATWDDDIYKVLIFQEVQNKNLIDKGVIGDNFMTFIIKSSEIDYYNKMKITCTLEAGIKDHNLSFDDFTDFEQLDSLGLKTLFNVTLKNLTWGNSAEESRYTFDLGYDSESGILYLLSADSEYFLLNTLSTSSKGRRIIDSMTVNTFAIPGLFNDPLFDIKDLFFVLTFTTVTEDGTITSNLTFLGDETITGKKFRINTYSAIDLTKSYISLRGRTNLI